jgi:hypothetical protein
VTADRAKSPQAREVERAEATHREASNRNPPAVEVVLAHGGRYRFPKDVRPPATVAAVVVIGVISAVREQDDRRPRSELVDRLADRAPRHVVRVARAAVEQHEQWPPFRVARRQDHGLLERAADKPALDREVG